MADGRGWAERTSGRHDDEGAAVVEFIALSLLLLVPLIYLVVTLSRIQAGAFAAEGAAHEAARTAVVTGVSSREHGASKDVAMAAGASRAQAAVALTADDFGFDPDDATLVLKCEGQCLEPGGNLGAQVTIVVTLPGIPGFLGGAIPLSVDVVGSARAPVDSVVNDR
ncbi:MAG: pilus assembly protein [Demequinaceae bacterium]|nr:pilus assembly protein [Demequinaceae bacterium]